MTPVSLNTLSHMGVYMIQAFCGLDILYLKDKMRCGESGTCIIDI